MSVFLAIGLLYLILGIAGGISNKKKRKRGFVENIEKSIIHPAEFNIRW